MDWGPLHGFRNLSHGFWNFPAGNSLPGLLFHGFQAPLELLVELLLLLQLPLGFFPGVFQALDFLLRFIHLALQGLHPQAQLGIPRIRGRIWDLGILGGSWGAGNGPGLGILRILKDFSGILKEFLRIVGGFFPSQIIPGIPWMGC